jgi:hypothetical protein
MSSVLTVYQSGFWISQIFVRYQWIELILKRNLSFYKTKKLIDYIHKKKK